MIAWLCCSLLLPPAVDLGDVSLYPARGVDSTVLQSDDHVTVTESDECWTFAPRKGTFKTALLFFPGGGVDPKAYAPLAKALAAKGCPTYLVRLSGLPVFFAEAHRSKAIQRGTSILKSAKGVERWVVAGHSMGASIAARFVYEKPKRFAGLILVATTHPRDFDLSKFAGVVTKIYASEDRVASHAKSLANKKLLPTSTRWIEIKGGNHAQFGHYGFQAGDGKATITREKQQQQAIKAILNVWNQVDRKP